jgi:hypothetical protein
MKYVLLRSFSNQLHFFNLFDEEESKNSIESLKQEILQVWGIPIDEQALYHNGRLIHRSSNLESLSSASLIDVNLKLQGGKGGFGSLLRGQAISKRKITNFDASRDLQGRRIRNVKYQQKIMEWAKKKKEEEKLIKKEVDEYNKVQKTIQGVQKDVRLTQEFKDKVDKWDNEMSSSIREGIKKAKKAKSKKQKDDTVKDEFEIPQKKICTEKSKNDAHHQNNHGSDALEAKISKKLASILNTGNEEDKIESQGEVKATEHSHSKEEQRSSEDKGQQEKEKAKEEIEYTQIDLSGINTMDDLIKLGPDHLKHELVRLGLKCGGSLQEKAKRLYDIKLKPELLFHPKYIAKK